MAAGERLWRKAVGGGRSCPDFRHWSFRHDEYLIVEVARPLVTTVVDAEPDATVKTLVKSLAHAQKQLGYGDSAGWRHAIGDTRALGGEVPRHLLIELLRDACVQFPRRRLRSAGLW
jgi:hypothetical protein